MRRFGFLLIPGFSMLSLAAAVEPLRMANAQAGKQLYTWDFLSWDGAAVLASNHMSTQPTMAVTQCRQLDVFLVVAGIKVAAYGDDAFFSGLRNACRQVPVFGATSTGSLLLAKAKLLRQRTCTIHWEYVDSFREQFTDVEMSGELYEFDGNIMTCSGGSAGMDMMLQVISGEYNYALAMQVAEQYMHPAIRPAHDDSRMRLQSRLNITNTRLVKAVEVMQGQLEQPLSSVEVAAAANMSVRQMERLFKQQFAQTPVQFYLQLRLQKAQHLLHQSSLSITQIANACGFNSVSYFARCYRQQFACTPSAER